MIPDQTQAKVVNLQQRKQNERQHLCKGYLSLVDLDVTRHSSKSKIVNTDEVRSCEVEDDTVFSADTNVADEGNQPCNEGERCPDDAARETISSGINPHGIFKTEHDAMF